jgi:hypothetical protein
VNWLAGWLGGSESGWTRFWLGIDEDLDVVPGIGPEGAGAFVLDLEEGFTVNMRWPTDIIKSRSGKEQRVSRNDQAKESYDGSAVITVAQAVEIRTSLAAGMARGDVFLLGLPHEALPIVAAESGATVFVPSTALCDWLNQGQRVRCQHPVGGSVDGVVQSSTATSITLDVAVGAAGAMGGEIMPLVATYLEPEQSFPRYATEIERFDIRARAAAFGFAPELPYLEIGPLTASAGLDAARVTARTPISEPIAFALVPGSWGAAGGFLESESLVFFGFESGVTTIGALVTALAGSTLVDLSGATDLAATLQAGDMVGEYIEVTGDSGPVGTGATLETYDSRPVWDYPIGIQTTNTDSIHAMTEIIDNDGVPYAVGFADVPDWGRAVVMRSEHREDWQWIKLFLATVKGRQKAFWLPTYRDDLPFVSKAANTITVEGDVAAWYPSQRQHVQVEEDSGTITRAEITEAVNNGDGTYTLTIGTTLATSSVRRVSWLERCRFESDEFTFAFNAQGFSFGAIARVVQQ